MLDRQLLNHMLESSPLGPFTFSPISTGHYNDSYYINSEKGKFVLRIAPPDSIPKLFYEIKMMESEVTIHNLVKQRTTLPVPEIIYHDFSRRIIDTDFLIMQYLPGSPGFFDEQQLGSFVKQLHAIKADRFGYPQRPAPTADNWPDIFRTYVKMIFDDCLRVTAITPAEYDWFLSIYKEHRHAITPVEPSLLHLDLWHQNILTENGNITGIIDFDRGLFGDSELEFAVLDTYGSATPDFFRGYAQPRPTDKNAQIRQRLYIVYELIKYAFIRLARGKNTHTARTHVTQCRNILKEIE